MPFAAGCALVALPAVLLPAVIGVRGPAARALASMVIAATDVILVITVVSVFDSFERGWVLGAHAAVGLGAVAAWWLAGRPAPYDGPPPRLVVRRLGAAAREHPAVAAAVVALAAALAIQLFLGIAIAQNNWDVMSYHLSRAAYWLQYDSVGHFPGGTSRQLGYPPNAEALQAWTMELARSDRLVALVQWLAGIGLALACFVVARFLGFSRSGATLAAALLAAMPIAILQTATAQNDVVVSFFLLAAVAFLVSGLRDRRPGELVLGGLALGLAVGTKNTAVIALPAVALIAAAVAWRARPPARVLATAVAAAAVGIAVLGAPNYVTNLRETGTLTAHASDHLEREDPVHKNAVMIAWGFVDFPGAGATWFDTLAQATAPTFLGDPIHQEFAYKLDTSPDDSRSAFGPVGLLLLGLLLAYAVRRRSPLERRAFAVAALAAMLPVLVIVQWNADITRTLLPAVALGAPLLAAIETRGLRLAVVVLSTLSLAACAVANEWRPLIEPGKQKVLWREDRTEQFAMRRIEVRPALQRLGEELPDDAPLGFVGPDDAWDYPLFGERGQRRVVRLDESDGTAATVRRERLAGILFAEASPPVNSGLEVELLAAGYSLGRVP